MSSSAPSSTSSSFAAAAAAANAISRNVLGGGVPAETRGNRILKTITNMSSAVVSQITAGAGAPGGGAEGQDANKFAELEAKLLRLESMVNEQNNKIRVLQDHETTVVEQMSEIEILKKTMAEQENEILSLKATLKTHQDTLHGLETTPAQQKDDLQGLTKQRDTVPDLASAMKKRQEDVDGLQVTAAEQDGLAAGLSKLGALLQGTEATTIKQHKSHVALESTVKKLQDDLQSLKTKVSGQLRGVEEAVAEQKASLQGLDEWTVETFKKTKESLSRELDNLAAEIHEISDKFKDDDF